MADTTPTKRVIDTKPGQTSVRPTRVMAEVFEDGCYHYGLVFDEVVHAKPQYRVTWKRVVCSACLLTSLAPPRRLKDGQLVRLLPRSRLILFGFLPVGVIFAPRRRFELRSVEVLLSSSWAELAVEPAL